MEQTITIRCGFSSAVLALPESDLYTGVRFDHAGVFREIRRGEDVYSARWLEGPEDPGRHDNVTGPAEEFSAIGYERALPGEVFLKIGVGLLRKEDGAPYDFTRSYPLVHGGNWSVETGQERVLFRHLMDSSPWNYDYRKEICWEEDGGLSIDHLLSNTGPAFLEGSVYNHNFFTFNGSRIGSGTFAGFPFVPKGNWRNWKGDAPVGRLTPGGIRLDRDLSEGEKVCIEHLSAADGEKTPYNFSIGNMEAGLQVDVRSEAPLSRIQFWANHRVACLEPFTPFSIAPGASFRWTLHYRFE